MAFDPAYLKASAQRALTGIIGPQILGIGVTVAGTRLVVSAYAAGSLGEEEREDLDSATAEIIADFPEAAGIELRVVERAKAPLTTDGIWAFLKPGTSVT